MLAPHPGIAGPIAELQRRVSLRGARTSDDFMTGLSEVVHDDPAFVDLFAGTVWGHIVWAKNVGRPLSPRLADAFVIVHKYQLIKGVANPGGSATNVGGSREFDVVLYPERTTKHVRFTGAPITVAF